MAIPDYQSVMLPLLKLVSDGREYRTRECIEKLADEFGLSEDERKELLVSGQQTVFDNRVGWARTYLKKSRSSRVSEKRVHKNHPKRARSRELRYYRNQQCISFAVCGIS